MKIPSGKYIKTPLWLTLAGIHRGCPLGTSPEYAHVSHAPGRGFAPLTASQDVVKKAQAVLTQKWEFWGELSLGRHFSTVKYEALCKQRAPSGLGREPMYGPDQKCVTQHDLFTINIRSDFWKYFILLEV